MGMRIREIGAGERPGLSVPIQMYAFDESPASDDVIASLRKDERYYESVITLLAEEDGKPAACATGIPMRQNIRGGVFPMAGVAGVATLPLARRRGAARAVVSDLLGRMRDAGCAVSSLYPFRPSFYERFGYAGLPRARKVRFPPTSAADLLKAGLPGQVTWEPMSRGFPAFRDVTEKLLAAQHGFSLKPGSMMERLRTLDDQWAVVGWDGGEPVAATTYRITGHAGTLVADDMLATGPLGRALLLKFFAAHIDQVTEIEMRIGPGELPELWGTDFAAVAEARISFPDSAAPMARVLSLTALAGLAAGPERVTVNVVDDHYVAGVYDLDGRSGSLEVTAGSAAEPDATLTAVGLSGLVYGSLGPEEAVIRGFGDIPRDSAMKLRKLFPPCLAYLYSRF